MARKVRAKPRPEPTPSPEPEYTGSPRKSLPVPAAVVLEICKNSHPPDVLYLARTCSTLRRVLRERSSSNAWKQAFRNVGLPPCPDDIPGPQYAAMFYESVCDGCGSGRCKKGRRDVHWDVRRRLCIKCSRKFLVDVPKICPCLPDGLLEDLVPTSGVAGSNGKAYEPMLRSVMDKIQTVAAIGAPELAAHIVDLRKRLAAIESHSRECEQWGEAEANKLIEEEDLALRQASVCSRLQNEGWGEQLDMYRAHVLSHPLVNQFKHLFDDDWKLHRERIKMDAEAKWTAKHEYKLLKQRKRDRYRRWVMAMIDLSRFEDDKNFQDGEVWPDGNDLRRMPELQPILDGNDVSADAAVTGAATDNGDVLQSSINGHTQPLANGDRAAGAMLKTKTTSEDPTPADHPDSVVRAGDSSERAIETDSNSEDEDNDNDCYYQDGPYYEETQSDSDESILPPGHGPDSPVSSPESDSDSVAVEEAAGDSTISAVQEEAAVSAAMDRLFPSALLAWRHSISLRLFGSIPDRIVRTLVGKAEISTDAAKIAFLSRAATVFECRGQDNLNDCWLSCGGDHSGLPKTWEGLLVFYPEALHHRDICAIENTSRMEHFEEKTRSVVFDAQEELRAAWSPNSLKISKEGSALMKKLVRAAGLDHRTATRREMDEVDARFVCKTCLDAPEPESETALKVHNWLSCLHDDFSEHDAFRESRHCGGQHPARFVRLTNPDAEARTRGLAPRGDKYQPLSVALSELGFPRESLVG